MANFYKILKADPLGAPWTPNVAGAKPIQTFWCQVEGQEKAVSIGKQVGNTLVPGQHVYGDLMYAKSQNKGTEYWKFKSQEVPEGVQRPADTPAQATAQQATGGATGGVMGEGIPAWFQPFGNMIVYLYGELKKMDADAPENQPKTPQTDVIETENAEPAKPEQISGEPIDPETQSTLDDIFTPPETPEDVPTEKK